MSDDANDQRGASEANDLARRQAALRALAHNQTQQTASEGVAPHTKPATAPVAARIANQGGIGGRRGAVIGVSLLVVAVIAGGVFGARYVLGQRAGDSTVKPVVRVNPAVDNMACIQSIAWSPSGRQLAALGNLQNGCGFGSADSQTDAIFIYDAVSGKLVQQLHPDPVVLNAAAVEHFVATNTSPASAPAMLQYQSLTWSPDSQALVMTFSVQVEATETSNQNGQSGPTPSIGGVVRLGVNHAALTALWADSANAIPYGSIERWDLTTGKSMFLPTPPTATRYRWNSDGTLAAAGSAAGGSVGAPNHGQTFSIWQPGVLQMAFGAPGPNGQTSAVQQDIIWGANITPISPDGRSYYPYFPAYGSLVPPSTKHAFPNEQSIAPRDAALLALANKLSATTPNENQNAQMLVTWRPDGRLLAAVSPTYGPSAGAATLTINVSLYDTRTGKVVARLTPNFAGLQTGNGGQEVLAWSPDGAHLALVDNLYGAITLWGPGALPA